MIPDNELSSKAVVSDFLFRVKTDASADRLQDWDMGGVALNDSSAGLFVQLWHFILEIGAEGVSNVYVEAPSVPKTLLFTGSYITEIAGTFDQNMNPTVAYMEEGIPKLWWYDSIEADMVHTILPLGCRDLRCTLDDKRTFAVADSDVILSYAKNGKLYMRRQRDRYEDEFLLYDEGYVGRLVCMAINKGLRLQWQVQGQQ